MDFELTEEQEALRDTVRRFLGERAALAYVREMLDDDRGTTDAGVAGPGRPRRHRAARARGARRRRDGHGRHGRGARGAGPGGPPGTVPLVGGRGGVDRARGGIDASIRPTCYPAWPTARSSARSRCSSPTARAEWRAPATASRATAAHGHQGDGARRRGGRPLARRRRTRRRARRVRRRRAIRRCADHPDADRRRHAQARDRGARRRAGVAASASARSTPPTPWRA